MLDFWKKYWQLVSPYKREMGRTLIWILLVQLLLLVDPYIFKMILDEISSFDEASYRTLAWLVAAFVISGAITTVVSNRKFKNLFHTILVMEREVPKRCMKKLMELSLGYHIRENTGAKMSKITRGSWRTTDVAASLFFDVGPIMIETILVFTVLLIMDWPLAIIFIAVIPLFVWQTKYIREKVEPLRKLRHDRYEKSDDLMTQAVVNVPAVQSFRQEEREYGSYRDLKHLLFIDERKEWFRLINFDYYRSGAILTGQILILVAGVWQTTNGIISVGSLVLFLMLSNKVYNSLYKLSFIYERVADATESVNRLISILDERLDIVENPDAVEIEHPAGHIEFQDVHFCYPNTNNGLHGVNLNIRAGETVGICGPSGGGKSTLVRLIPRFYDVCSGAIKIDRHDVRELKFSFRNLMAIVPQEVEIFDATIAENIAYGCPGASLDEIKAASRVANVDEFVDGLEKGYETTVGERGLKLSGGQRQRVGIARAILCDPAVLIFDEATSHLDPISEQLIQESIQELQGTRTMILIAHRLSTIQSADQIVVLNSGRIKEQGTHQELIELGGLYHELATRQSTEPN